MKYLVWPAFIFLSLFLQSRMTVLGVAPNFTTLLTFYAGIRYGETRGLLLGAMIGLLEDSISPSLIGPNLLSKSIVGFSSALLVSGSYFRWTHFLGLLAVSLLTLIDNLVVFLTKTIFDTLPAAPSSALFIAVMQSVMNAAAGLFIRPKHVE